MNLSFLQRAVHATSAVRNLVSLKAIILCCANISEIHFRSSLPYCQTNTAARAFIYQGHDSNLTNRIAVLTFFGTKVISL